MTMGDNIVVMDEGVVKQVGTPLEIHDEPSCVFVAQFIGDPGMNIITLGSGNKVGFRPRNIAFAKDDEARDADTCYASGTVLAIENHGSEMLYFVDIGVGKCYIKTSDRNRKSVDEKVVVKFPFSSCYAFGSDENRIYDEKKVREVYDEFRCIGK
jgi:sn-glycerol 3-phosphate transport system ATP-binding protein